MPFDLTTAKPVTNHFDPNTSTAVTPDAPTDAAVTAAPQESGMSTTEKWGLGALAAGASAAAVKYPELRTALQNFMDRVGVKAAETPLWKQAGLRTAEEAPVARNLAGPSGREALQLHNAEVGRTIAANEAGIPAGDTPPLLSLETLKEARRAPIAFMDRVANTVPTGAPDAQAREAIQQAGLPSGGRMTTGSPDAQAQIGALKQQLLDPARQFTGQQFINEIRGLREEGFGNVTADDVSNRELGKAQLSMARALEGHVERSLPTDGDVTLDKFLSARKMIAKNLTVQGALRGGDVDMKALARAQRADPGVLDGGTKLLADFGDTHPEVAGLPADTTRYNPPSISHDIENISLKSPTSWIRPALGGLARRALTGNTEDAVAQANSAFPARLPGSFSPPPAAPAPRFGGYLPAPSTVNAGGGATTENTLRDLGLTPDVQAAAQQHPGVARLQALREQLSRPPMQQMDFQGPQKWGEFTLAPQNLPKPVAAPETVPFEDVLEQGGTQGKPIAGIKSGYRPAPQSGGSFGVQLPPEGVTGLPPGRIAPVGPSKAPNVRTPPGAPELTEFTPYTPSAAQMNFRHQQAADRLRKVAGDLRLEGPGGNTGSPLDRLRAALERRDRGYADGGEVRNSSSPASPGVGGAVKDALAALRNYLVTVPQRRLQAEREGMENTVINDTADHGPAQNPPENYDAGGAVPSAAQEEAIAQATRQLSDLVSLHEQAPPQSQMADGGAVDDPDAQSSVRKIANVARGLTPTIGPQDPEERARIATNLSSLLYGLDAQGNPALGGRAWTKSQGGTPAGILDALTATPHNLVQFAAAVDRYLPGKSNPQFWASVDPQWSQSASQRLGALKQRLQKAAGVAPAQSLGDTALDIVTDPSMVGPMGVARVAGEGTALRKLLSGATGSSETPKPATQGP